jgi:hypothetical protein
VRNGDELTTFIVPKVEKIRSLNLPDPQGPVQACNGKPLPYTVYVPVKGFCWLLRNTHVYCADYDLLIFHYINLY